jgi:hypothetical protein
MRPRSQTRVQEDGSLQSSGLGDMWPFIWKYAGRVTSYH